MNEKTITPGMESPYQGSNFSNSNAYMPNPGMGGMSDNQGTVAPGMEYPAGNTVAMENKPTKPIVGFLYSVSRVPSGEFWPVYLGANVIGRDSSCDILLPEASVSREHAVLVVRKNRKPEKLVAVITDKGSSYGTMVNGESLIADPKECKSNNIITIGNNYELFFVLIDTCELGLKLAPDFAPVGVSSTPAETSHWGNEPISNGTQGYPQGPSGFPAPGGFRAPRFTGPDMPISNDGTMGTDGNFGPQTGGTITM